VRRLGLGILLVIASVLSGLLIASLWLHEECPLCSGTTWLLRENPSLAIETPVVLDCPRCDDKGRVSILNARIGRTPDPVIAALMRHSNRESWRAGEVRDLLRERLKQSELRRASGAGWGGRGGMLGRARFLRQDGRCYVLLLLSALEWVLPEDGLTRAYLFDESGRLLDAVDLAVQGGASVPAQAFVLPALPKEPCARIRLLTWKNNLFERIEIDHAGKLWKETPSETSERLGLVEWTLHLADGRLQVRDARGNSIAD
jgi:hypothetical protein